MLSQRLKELEAEGIVVRTVIPETPVRVEYSLTEKGRALQAAIEAVSGWADQWLAGRSPEAEDAAAKTPTPGASP
jgi:DNA-binding HxlR family transcriptional regulator